MNSVLDAPLPESAKCQVCKATLQFSIGTLGTSIEQCPNRRCVNHRPHRPQPDTLGPVRAMPGEGPRGIATRNARRLG